MESRTPSLNVESFYCALKWDVVSLESQFRPLPVSVDSTQKKYKVVRETRVDGKEIFLLRFETDGRLLLCIDEINHLRMDRSVPRWFSRDLNFSFLFPRLDSTQLLPLHRDPLGVLERLGV